MNDIKDNWAHVASTLEPQVFYEFIVRAIRHVALQLFEQETQQPEHRE